MKYRIPAVALSLVLALGGCRGAEVPAGAADNSETWKIGISFPTTDLIYRETMMELLKEYEKDHPEVDLLSATERAASAGRTGMSWIWWRSRWTESS